MAFVNLSRRAALLGAFSSISALAFSARGQAKPASPADLTILTVGGLIDAPNRAPFDPARDKLFDHANVRFERARAFTLLELAALPQQTARVRGKTGEIVYEGPALGDIVRLAGAKPEAKTARLVALDGYAADIPASDIAPQNWVLASSADGRPLGLGGLGPLYAVRELGQGVEKSEEEDMKWVHSIFYIDLI